MLATLMEKGPEASETIRENLAGFYDTFEIYQQTVQMIREGKDVGMGTLLADAKTMMAAIESLPAPAEGIVNDVLKAVSYTHLTLPTNREV